MATINEMRDDYTAAIDQGVDPQELYDIYKAKRFDTNVLEAIVYGTPFTIDPETGSIIYSED